MQEFREMKFGPYQIQSHLANGGMANVYLGYNVEAETEPLVAIKLVHTSAGESCKLFRREIKEHCALHHKHILPIITYGERNYWCYLVTPYIESGTLTHRLKQGPLSLQEATEIFSQLADALHYAHKQGIVHRDIKSSNILMRDKHHVYLADFGLAKQVRCETSLTLSGYLMGTPEYMAPELSEEDASPGSDIYALGVLLYQMLTGSVPFKGNSPLNIYLKHIQEQPVPPSALNPTIPPEVDQIVLRALEKNPAHRYPTAKDFNIAYQNALRNIDMQQFESYNTFTFFSDPTIPIPKVRIVKIGDLHRQLQKASLSRRRRLAQGFVVLAAISALLMLSLLSVAGKNALQTPRVQAPTGLQNQVTHDLKSPTQIHSLTPPMTPTSRPIAPVLPNKSYGNNNDSISNTSDEGNGNSGGSHHGDSGKKGGNNHGHGHHGHGG